MLSSFPNVLTFCFCCCSFTKLCLTVWELMDCSTLGFSVLHHLPELAQTHTQSQWCHPTISSSAVPFSSSLQSFPASGTFPRSWLFTSDGQSIQASASALPMNIQDWFPLGLTGWISLQSKGLLRVFSNTIKSINSSLFSCLYSLALTSVHDYWKNHSLD